MQHGLIVKFMCLGGVYVCNCCPVVSILNNYTIFIFVYLITFVYLISIIQTLIEQLEL